MAQRRSLAWTELRVGLLVIFSFLLLAAAIFFVGGESGLFTRKYTVYAYFPSANGLRDGAEVWLEGVTIGNVTSVKISPQADPNRSVEIAMRLDRTYENIIRSDSVVSIGTIGLLGNKNVEITRGTEEGTVVPEGGYLQGSEAGDIRQIVTGTNDFIANLNVLSDQIVKMSERVDRGEGTLGKLLTDSSIYDNLDATTLEAKSLVEDIRTGQGTVGKLVSDDALYRRVDVMLDRVDTLVATIQKGEGTLGKFYKDPELYNRSNQFVARLNSITDGIARGEGTLGRITKDDALYNKLNTTIDRFDAIAASMEKGEGTAGKLLKDPTLYNGLTQAASEIQKLLYDFRQDPRKFLTITVRLF